MKDPYPDLTEKQTYNVLCIGGSTVFGITTDKGDKSAPDFLQEKLLGIKIKDKPVRVYNGGIPGATTESIAKTLLPRYASIKPDVVIFYEAINTQPPYMDAGVPVRLNSYLATKVVNDRKKKNVTKLSSTFTGKKYGDDIEALIRQIKKIKAIPVLITYSIPFSLDDPPEVLSYWDRMTTAAETVSMSIVVKKNNENLVKKAGEHAVHLADSRPLLDRKQKYFTDHCHLTQEGLKLLAGLMAGAVMNAAINEPDSL